jgi:hypothetical protein
MRRIHLARVSSVFGAMACLALGSWAAAQDVKGAGPTAAPAAAATPDAPELRPGEILIRRTGHTKRVVTVARPGSDAPSQPPAAAATPARVAAAEDSGDKPGPRSVTIGYMVREPMEMGAGPQVYEGSPYLPNNSYGCGYYGYNSYLPSYGYGGIGYGGGCRTYAGGIGYGGGFGYRSYGSYGGYGSFGGRSSFARPSSAPITYARRAK